MQVLFVSESTALVVKERTVWNLKSIPFDGIPLMFAGSQTRMCMHGPERHAKDETKDQAKM
jgi:hypothetical protein